MTETMELKPMPDEIYAGYETDKHGDRDYWMSPVHLAYGATNSTRYIRADLAQPSAPADVVENPEDEILRYISRNFTRNSRFLSLLCALQEIANGLGEDAKKAQKYLAAYEASLQPTEKG